jgi:hypothetical protein
MLVANRRGVRIHHVAKYRFGGMVVLPAVR